MLDLLRACFESTDMQSQKLKAWSYHIYLIIISVLEDLLRRTYDLQM